MSAEGGDRTVARFDCTSGGQQFCQGCYTMTLNSEGDYVRHEDYAKLEQQRDALVEALLELQREIHGGPAQPWEKADAALKAAGVLV